ncbi:hypothetical protein ACFXG4_50040 [Nocardia sp. NPDC059246]|uniref:hypothetical protein n=1 Tax=unclassified Nocardia TaxID=2637762 RepID=UPI0036BE30B7
MRDGADRGSRRAQFRADTGRPAEHTRAFEAAVRARGRTRAGWLETHGRGVEPEDLAAVRRTGIIVQVAPASVPS